MMKRNLIRYLLPVAVITVLAVILIFINAYSLGKREADAEVEQLYGIVGIIREKYPNVSEEEIVHSLKEWGRGTEELTDDEVRRLGKNILDKYGYEGGFLSNAQKKNLKTAGLFGALIVIFTGAMIGLYDMVVGAKRRKDIEELTTYLNKLTNRIYDLQLKENSEDELSLLRNEIYKTTVSLRETSELSKKENAALTRSLEDISHQLKTPLTSIRIMLDNIIEDDDMPAPVRKDFLESISRQMEWIQSLVISLLKLARIDAGTVKLKKEDVNLEELVKDSIEKLAVIIANNIRNVYPLPSLTKAIATTTLGEVTRTRAVAVLAELGYHDNDEDAEWLRTSLNAIAANLVQSLCDYFGLPFIEPVAVVRGVVATDGSNLNLRAFPSTQSRIVGAIPNGSAVTVYGQTGGWYVVTFGGLTGYAAAEFIAIG